MRYELPVVPLDVPHPTKRKRIQWRALLRGQGKVRERFLFAFALALIVVGADYVVFLPSTAQTLFRVELVDALQGLGAYAMAAGFGINCYFAGKEAGREKR